MVKFKLKIYKIDIKIKLAIAMLVLKTFLSFTTLTSYSDMLDNALAFFSVGLFVLVILEKRYARKTLLTYAIISLFGLYSAVQIGNVGFLITIITCFAIREENIDVIIKYIYQIELFLFLTVVVISSLMSVIGIKSITTVISGELRYNFGFSHPNTFSMFLFNLILMWTYINFNRIRTKNVVAIFLSTTIAYSFTKTRTFLIDVGCLLLILMIIKINSIRINNVLSVVARFITPALAGFTYALALLYMTGSNVAIAIDNILSYRIRLAAYGLVKYGVSLFGKNLSNIKVVYDQYWGLNSFTFDNIYAYLITNIGIVWLIIICICFYLLAKKKEPKLCLCIIVWALYGMTEVHGMNCYECFPILMCTMLLKTKKKNEGEKNGKYYCADL